jgi:UTP--glucose-1-phosphate uridylyltransferase
MTVRKCLFPAAGYGTRFLPATKAMPKEMLPILDKPLIQYAVEEAFEAGMSRIAFVTGRNKRAIEDYFDINYEIESKIRGTAAELKLDEVNQLIRRCTFSYTRQIDVAGLGHAILTGETLIGDEPFGVILADDLCVGGQPPLFSRMVKLFEHQLCHIVAIQRVPHEDTSKYGIVDVEPIGDGIFEIHSLIEKPDPAEAPSDYAIIGRYILLPRIFETLSRTPPGRNGELQITDALSRDLGTVKILGCEVTGRRFDCGSVQGFFEATRYFYESYSS